MTFGRIIGLMNLIAMLVMLDIGSYGIAFFNLAVVAMCAVDEFMEGGE